MGCKYVKDFTFSGDQGYTGSAGKTMVRGYARGGHVDEPMDRAVVKEAVHKHEKGMHPGKPLTKLQRGGIADTARSVQLGKQLAAAKQNPSPLIQTDRAAGLRQQLANAGDQMQSQRDRQAGLNQQLAAAQAGNQMQNQRDREGGLRQQLAATQAGNQMQNQRDRQAQMDVQNLALNMRKRYPVDNREPMIGMKKGGMTPKQLTKVDTVIGEYKRGKLHSGSKTGPVVTNPKQATAIALSEARQVGKKRS